MYLLSCQPRTVFKNGRNEIDYLDTYKCLHLNWSGNISVEDYKQVMMQMLRLTKKFRTEFWVLDARDGDFFQLIDIKWAETFYTIDLPHLPIKKIARIACGDFHYETQLSSIVTSVLDGKDVPFRFKYLPDVNHAIAWFLDDEDCIE